MPDDFGVCFYASCIPTWFRFLHVLPAAAPVGHAVDGVAGVLALALAGVVHQPVRAQLPAGATCNMTHVYMLETRVQWWIRRHGNYLTVLVSFSC